jgi:hypothetical protein
MSYLIHWWPVWLIGIVSILGSWAFIKGCERINERKDKHPLALFSYAVLVVIFWGLVYGSVCSVAQGQNARMNELEADLKYHIELLQSNIDKSRADQARMVSSLLNIDKGFVRKEILRRIQPTMKRAIAEEAKKFDEEVAFRKKMYLKYGMKWVAAMEQYD